MLKGSVIFSGVHVMWDSATGVEDLPWITSKGVPEELKEAFRSERGKIERVFAIFKNRFLKFHKGSQIIYKGRNGFGISRRKMQPRDRKASKPEAEKGPRYDNLTPFRFSNCKAFSLDKRLVERNFSKL